jgi:hypothetical protein
VVKAQMKEAAYLANHKIAKNEMMIAAEIRRLITAIFNHSQNDKRIPIRSLINDVAATGP